MVLQSQLSRKTEAETQPRLLTVKEAARYLRVSVSTPYGWVWQRRIPFVKIGRALRFDPIDLEAYVGLRIFHIAISKLLQAYPCGLPINAPQDFGFPKGVESFGIPPIGTMRRLLDSPSV